MKPAEFKRGKANCGHAVRETYLASLGKDIANALTSLFGQVGRH